MGLLGASWKPSTRAEYERVLEGDLLPILGRRKVSTLTAADVQQVASKLRAWGRSPGHTHRSLHLLKQILCVGGRRRWLPKGLFADLPIRALAMTEVDPLAPREVEAFLESCPLVWRPYFETAFRTGLCRARLAASEWGDVDWARGTLRIVVGKARKGDAPQAEGPSWREVEMRPALLEALKVQKALNARHFAETGGPTAASARDYVFIGPFGEPLQFVKLKPVWDRALARAGLRPRTMVQTRHSFAANALAAGEDPAWVAAMLGHITPRMVLEIYEQFVPRQADKNFPLSALFCGSPHRPMARY